ncbi:MAG TPA: EamA family transporter [Aestuariivirga sp.]|nr:EamA family transporter [Alphaproteobacteria bacterium]HRX35901.1 EamA family transporter [Aestuariivirga sp.]
MNKSPAHMLITVAPVLFVLMWATGFVVARLSAPHVEPLTFLAIRFPIAGAIFFVIALIIGAPWPGHRLALHAMVAGAFLHGGYLAPVYWAVAHGMPAGVSALIVGLQPLITAILAHYMVNEHISSRHWIGLAVGIAGVGLVIWPKLSFAALGGITPLTTAVNVLGAVAIAFGTVYQKRYGTGLNLASGGTWQYAGASIVVIAAALMVEDFRFDGSFNAWFALGWSVIVLSLGAITLLMLLIRHGNVGRVSSLIFLVPGVSALMAYGLFGETLTAVQILGMAVCAAAVLIVTRRPSRPS